MHHHSCAHVSVCVHTCSPALPACLPARPTVCLHTRTHAQRGTTQRGMHGMHAQHVRTARMHGTHGKDNVPEALFQLVCDHAVVAEAESFFARQQQHAMQCAHGTHTCMHAHARIQAASGRGGIDAACKSVWMRLCMHACRSSCVLWHTVRNVQVCSCTFFSAACAQVLLAPTYWCGYRETCCSVTMEGYHRLNLISPM